MSAIQDAMAEIAALGADLTAYAERKRNDTRLAYLKRVSEATELRGKAWRHEATITDFAAYRMGSESVRHARAGCLIRARVAQLGGFHAEARTNLKAAARAHTEERFRAASEKIDRHMEAIDTNLADARGVAA